MIKAFSVFYSIPVCNISLGRSVIGDRNDKKWKSLESNYLYFSRYT